MNGQAYLVAAGSPSALDILAAIKAEGEDREDEPVEAQDDDELDLVECLIPRQPGAATAP